MGSVVKVSFTRVWGNAGRAKVASHKNYIEWRPDEPGAQPERKRPDEGPVRPEDEEEQEKEFLVESEKGTRRSQPRPFFSADSDHVSSREIDRSIKAMKDGEVMFRIMLSPGSEAVDALGHAREVMRALSQQKGQDFQWVGGLHENTDHQHIHVMLWDRDKEGGRVTLRSDDMMRMRSYGDRHIERELGLEMTFSLGEEEFARGRGLNLAFDSDRDRFMDVLNVPSDKVYEANRKMEPVISTLEWGVFDDEWRKFQVDYTGRESRAHLGTSSYHAIGRQSDLMQLGDNKQEQEFWKDLGENDPEMKDIAERKLEEIGLGDKFLRNSLGEKTKVIDEDQFLSFLSQQLQDEHSQEQEDLAALFAPIDEKKELQGKDEIAEIGGQSVDALLGFDPNFNSDAENPLAVDYEFERPNDFFDALLGTSKEEIEIEPAQPEIRFKEHAELEAVAPKEPELGIKPEAPDLAIDSMAKEVDLARGDDSNDWEDFKSAPDLAIDSMPKEVDLNLARGDDSDGWSDFESPDEDNDFDSEIWGELWSGIEAPSSTDFDHDRKDDNDEIEFTFDPTGMN
jgi:hypothetical protein